MVYYVQHADQSCGCCNVSVLQACQELQQQRQQAGRSARLKSSSRKAMKVGTLPLAVGAQARAYYSQQADTVCGVPQSVQHIGNSLLFAKPVVGSHA
jgi:hypothetical protein